MERKYTFLLLMLTLVPVLSYCAPEIQFSFGRVQGVDKQAETTQRPYYAYYGIPFAQPPLGINLRFRAPQPFVGSGPNVVISSNNYRSGCSQTNVETSATVSEDCLYLNVFTPQDLSSVKKVMFWIHGGGFTAGDATIFKPSRLVTDYDVIVVTTQYRLGPYGFLTIDKGNANIGLRDQIMALKWVKDNIGQFGGDPDGITIFGESAGSSSVSFLMLSPLTKSLFTKAIMQSGTSIAWSRPIGLPPDQMLYQSAEKLGCSSILWYLRWFNKEYFEQLIMECIRSKSEREILRLFPGDDLDIGDVGVDGDTAGGESDEGGAGGAIDWEAILGPGLSYGPIVDGEVVPRDPRSLLADRQYLEDIGALDRDYIMGFNNNEALMTAGLFSFIPIEVFTQPENARDVIKYTAKPNFPSEISLTPHIMDLLNYQYGYPRLEDGRAPVEGLFDVSTDVFFAVPTVYLARALTSASDRTNVYLYLFDHYPQQKDPSGPLKGSNHALDISYEFDEDPYFINFQSFYAQIPSPADGNLADIFRGALTQFAKTGNPSRVTGEPRNWPRFDPQQEYYLAISPTPEVRQHVFAKRVSLWTDFVFKINPFSGSK